ncbi:head GIN domain-containing protein [Aestuariibaculum suncheonense]|uniref:DUF2807 domain-containing protein n=1 Tax=Aestuariibaculum suncheonense TaxID=1028745 RepID=A0A8J6UCU1_9FLAO|nr:head GIN domain-containing protein [Aestuariibaculum suncheonense]MBD0836940.1 DUF2807 domain-containing protein [Aestuariibaculum suncheonense]
MTTLIKIIVTTILSLSLFSCNFDVNFNSGVKGNGNVITEERSISEPFTAIKATEGLDVYLTQSNQTSVTVEADENLQALIITEVIDGTLKIHCEKNIGRCKSKKVIVNFKDISSIKSTSGSDVFSTNTIIADYLNLESTSGSDMKLDVNTNSLICKTTSGSDLKVSGKTKKLVVESTSGSDFKGANLIAESSQVKASSGADITVNSLKELTADASSGADIKYLGQPESISKNSSSSGSIKKQ